MKTIGIEFVKELTAQDEPLYKTLEKLAKAGKELNVGQPENKRLKIETIFDGTRINPELSGSITNLFSDNFTPEAFNYAVLEGMIRTDTGCM